MKGAGARPRAFIHPSCSALDQQRNDLEGACYAPALVAAKRIVADSKWDSGGQCRTRTCDLLLVSTALTKNQRLALSCTKQYQTSISNGIAEIRCPTLL